MKFSKQKMPQVIACGIFCFMYSHSYFSGLTPATRFISGLYQLRPCPLIALFIAFFNRGHTGAIRIMEFF